ncbi:hypothetical protein [Lysobacter gummosus]|uniref:hypothetical protein n=1 Tax=Lysobacter gummosus TaxID=262324 RepID=UPI00362D55B8
MKSVASVLRTGRNQRRPATRGESECNCKIRHVRGSVPSGRACCSWRCCLA